MDWGKNNGELDPLEEIVALLIGAAAAVAIQMYRVHKKKTTQMKKTLEDMFGPIEPTELERMQRLIQRL